MGATDLLVCLCAHNPTSVIANSNSRPCNAYLDALARPTDGNYRVPDTAS
ncbi:MAG: hypothetical protein RML73_08035 [Anaerolineae bacterium]|nr:hypothetical protein [Anaerolineae bacterium]